MALLDDLKMIHERDGQDALGLAEKQWQQLALDFVFEPTVTASSVAQVVYAAMGSSALAGDLAKSFDLTVPFEVVRGYHLPAYVGKDTMVIAGSYSGNTEETLEAVMEAKTRGAKVAVITAGGRLAALAREQGWPLAILPKVTQPRFVAIANLKALAQLLQAVGVLPKNRVQELAEAAPFLRQESQAWLPTVPTTQNIAKQIAQECIGKSVVVYSGPILVSAGYKWKIAFNENAKQVAWAGQYPEFNHNEFTGWTKQPIRKPYAIINLLSDLDNPRITRRFELTKRLLSGLRPEPLDVHVAGHTPLEQLLWALNLGDFVTIYTGLLNGVNPTPVELVEKFKKLMEE